MNENKNLQSNGLVSSHEVTELRNQIKVRIY
jgi:hypothetical protein